MHFTSAIINAILATSTMVSARPSTVEGPTARRATALVKRADFDPKKACNAWKPNGVEWAVITTTSHNVVWSDEDRNFSSELTDGVAILVDGKCNVIGSEDYVPRGGGKGFEANFKGIPGQRGTYDVRARVATMGPPFKLANAEVQTNGKDSPVRCTGERHNIEGLDVDYWNSCIFA